MYLLTINGLQRRAESLDDAAAEVLSVYSHVAANGIVFRTAGRVTRFYEATIDGDHGNQLPADAYKLYMRVDTGAL